MFNLAPCPVRLGGVAEAVVTDDASGMQDHPVPYHHPREDVDARVDYAIRAYLGAGAYGHIVIYLRAVADRAALADRHIVPHGDPFPDLGAPGYMAAATVPFVLFLMV